MKSTATGDKSIAGSPKGLALKLHNRQNLSQKGAEWQSLRWIRDVIFYMILTPN